MLFQVRKIVLHLLYFPVCWRNRPYRLSKFQSHKKYSIYLTYWLQESHFSFPGLAIEEKHEGRLLLPCWNYRCYETTFCGPQCNLTAPWREGLGEDCRWAFWSASIHVIFFFCTISQTLIFLNGKNSLIHIHILIIEVGSHDSQAFMALNAESSFSPHKTLSYEVFLCSFESVLYTAKVLLRDPIKS